MFKSHKNGSQKSKTQHFAEHKNKPHATGSRQGFNKGPRTSRRPIKKFDPSLFIKKVEEQTATAAYEPQHSFADFAIDQRIKDNIAQRGYKLPTPVQDQAIPVILEGRDIVASANTGTGKTAAFLIPLIHNVLAKKTSRVLIIAPTRELADQIQQELNIFKAKTGLFSAVCIGGVAINPQIQKLQQQPQFVIGTPGRLIDLEKNRQLSLAKFDALVLDEVDTMLDMGFINDIKYLAHKLPQKRQNLFFSATLSPAVKSVMDSFLQDPVAVSVKSRQSAESVNQTVVKVDAHNKLETLHDILIKPGVARVIVFCRTKHATDKLARQLKERGFKAVAIHGDKTQGQRKKALEQFKDDVVTILLATDVVARGIDIDDVSHVINYDLPQTHEDYIHRIGRTGRADKIGQAITFIE